MKIKIKIIKKRKNIECFKKLYSFLKIEVLTDSNPKISKYILIK